MSIFSMLGLLRDACDPGEESLMDLEVCFFRVDMGPGPGDISGGGTNKREGIHIPG